MLKCDLQTYIDAAADDSKICVVVCSFETGEIVITYDDVGADISRYGELIINVAI